VTSGRDAPLSAYRDELIAAQARIAELEARLLAHDDDDASPRFAELHAARAHLVAQGRRFAGLGPNGLAALVVMVLVLGSVSCVSPSLTKASMISCAKSPPLALNAAASALHPTPTQPRTFRWKTSKHRVPSRGAAKVTGA